MYSMTLGNPHPELHILLFLEVCRVLIDGSRLTSPLMGLADVGSRPIRALGYFRSRMPYLEQVCCDWQGGGQVRVPHWSLPAIYI